MITNIILDMDGTLLDHDIDFRPIPRAYLAEFMTFVFANFERVSIWTAAARDWYECCYRDVLSHHIPEGKDFYFVKTRDDFNVHNIVKPLSMIYAEHPEHTPENTLIVDDNHETFSQNMDNAVPVVPFFYLKMPVPIREDMRLYDRELLYVMEMLSQRLRGETTKWAYRAPLSLTLD